MVTLEVLEKLVEYLKKVNPNAVILSIQEEKDDVYIVFDGGTWTTIDKDYLIGEK